MRFVADEGISPLTVRWLHEQREQGIFSADDSLVLAFALANQAVLLTRDISDFSRISHLVGEPQYGIVLLRPGRNETSENVNSLLARFLEQFGKTDMTGRIVVITPKRIRVRPSLED